MKNIEENALNWAYDSSIPFPRNKIIEAIKKHPYAVDAETVLTSFELWKELTTEENLPNPLCHRILPIQAGFWNRIKGGSDVLMQLRNNTKSEPPIKSPQSSVVDRNIALVTACIHRVIQIALQMKTWMCTLLWMAIKRQEIQGQALLKHCMTLSMFLLPGLYLNE